MARESQRLQELKDLEILDTPPEAEFDELTLLASEICQTPIALVSLIDKNRQWFKSKCGVSIQETPREISICQYVIAQGTTLVVEDLAADIRFKNSRHIFEPQIAFYAGAPLITSKGFAIGTLCVVDRMPRSLTDGQIKALETLARNIVRILELRRNLSQVNELAAHIAQRESLLVESAKMSSLGQMAGGIAHEINNPLTIISLYGTKIKDLVGAGKMDADLILNYANKIQETTQRIAKIIRGMRDFCGDGDKDPLQVVSLKSLIEDTLSFCHEKKMRMGITFYWKQPNRDFEVECCPVQISQVLLNLLNNSCDALTHRSTKRIELELLDHNNFVEIHLTDSGHGIPDSIRDRVFHPFFSTKEVGQGIGLGLSISKGIVESHGGVLSFDSGSEGTCFKVRLPKSR